MDKSLAKPVIAFVIPSYEPNERLLEVIKALNLLLESKQGFPCEEIEPRIIVVDDGSSDEHQHIFTAASQLANCVLLRHATNQGKGRALKTAISYCLTSFDDLRGMITLDSDGQHLPSDVIKCAKALLEAPDTLILGVRDFDGQNVPAKSRMGNKLTRNVFAYLCGVRVSDTQTGLRGIPTAFLPSLLNVSGERFEYETNMLVESKKKNIAIKEVVIETVYIEGNKSTHFNPLRDSFLIYAIFLKYIFSSTGRLSLRAKKTFPLS
jgi:glycosyltransferase involved in cell wall biosynthesis